MMENGVRQLPVTLPKFMLTRLPAQTISEFGTHDELIKKNGPYAALYHASI